MPSPLSRCLRSLAATATLFAASCLDAKPDPTTGITAAELINNPTDGGPFGSNITIWCSNQLGSYCYGPSYSSPLLTATPSVVARMDAAAQNWGCSNQAGLFGQPVGTVTGGFYKWYGVTGDGLACGLVYWNNARQAAFFVANAERQCNTGNCNAPLPLNHTNRKLYEKYAALNWQDGVLGLPISNPVPYGWNGVTYQLFTGGVITYRNGQSAAYYAGGTGSRKVVTDRFLTTYGATPNAGNPLYGLVKDIANTCLTAGWQSCTSVDDTGDHLQYWDAYWGGNGYVIARDGWTEAFEVSVPIYAVWNNNQRPPIYNGGTPWSGSTLGFPLGGLMTVGIAANGQAIQVQQFERGAASWQPKGCATTVKTCPAAGTQFCTTYGALSTNLVAALLKQSSTAAMSADADLALCPSTSTIAPLCTASWVRHSATVRWKYQCASSAALPLTITLQLLAQPGGWWYDIELPSSAYNAWLLGGDVAGAIEYWGIPAEGAVHRNARHEVDWVDFPNGRLYTGVFGGTADGVHKGIWTKYQSLGAQAGELGWPLGPSTPRTGYPRYQYFSSGYRIDATSDTSATVLALFDDCSLVCRGPARLGDPTIQCKLGGQPSTCGYWGYTTGDADLDAIPDTLETALIARFRPWMRGQCSTAFAQAYGVQDWTGDCASYVPAGPHDELIRPLRRNGGAHASAVVRFTNSSSPSNSDLADTTHTTWDGSVERGFNCGKKGQPDGSAFEDKRCIEIIYTTPYSWDTGDPQTGLYSHRGDSEVISVLIARRDPYSYNRPPRWGKSWGQATSASDWFIIKSFGSSHLTEEATESSSFRTYTRAADATPNTQFTNVTSFVARGKNGNYWFDSDCDNGGYWADDCDDTTVWQNRYLNAGEQLSHPDGIFLGNKLQMPATESYFSTMFQHPEATYDVWSMTSAFTASGDPYGEKLRRGFMMWARGGVQYQTPSDDGVCVFVQQPPPATNRHVACYNPEDPWW